MTQHNVGGQGFIESLYCGSKVGGQRFIGGLWRNQRCLTRGQQNHLNRMKHLTYLKQLLPLHHTQFMFYYMKTTI